MLHVYYGMGKGKTSTLNGSAIRASGANKKVLIVRFLKGQKTSEDSQLKKLGITIMKTQTSKKFIISMEPMEKLKTWNETKEAMKKIKMNASKYDLIILDEFLDLTVKNVNFFTERQLLKFLKIFECEVMISGHNKAPRIFKHADLITHFEPEKHYFEKGIKARKGIEF